jgi:hypothetical protein
MLDVIAQSPVAQQRLHLAVHVTECDGTITVPWVGEVLQSGPETTSGGLAA